MKAQITDEQAVDLLKSTATSKAGRFATVPVVRTIIFPVELNRNGVKEIVFRPYVRMYSYTTERRWNQALEIEKEFKKANEVYTQSLKDANKPTSWKPPANPLNFTPLGRE